jgi:hypothetical protein
MALELLASLEPERRTPERRKIMKVFVLAAAFALVSLSSALAQDQGGQGGHGGGRAAFMQACGQDMSTYCATAQTREDRHACVQANQDKFSDGCKAFLANHMAMHGQGGDQPHQ